MVAVFRLDCRGCFHDGILRWISLFVERKIGIFAVSFHIVINLYSIAAYTISPRTSVIAVLAHIVFRRTIHRNYSGVSPRGNVVAASHRFSALLTSSSCRVMICCGTRNSWNFQSISRRRRNMWPIIIRFSRFVSISDISTFSAGNLSKRI